MQAPAPRKSWRDSARVCRLLPGNLRRNREGFELLAVSKPSLAMRYGRAARSGGTSAKLWCCCRVGPGVAAHPGGRGTRAPVVNACKVAQNSRANFRQKPAAKIAADEIARRHAGGLWAGALAAGHSCGFAELIINERKEPRASPL